MSRGFLNPFEIRSFQSNHADRPKMSQLLTALKERRRRDVNRKIGDGLSVRERFQYPAGLSAAATPQLDHGDRWREMLDDSAGMAIEESQLGTRQPIFR